MCILFLRTFKSSSHKFGVFPVSIKALLNVFLHIMYVSSAKCYSHRLYVCLELCDISFLRIKVVNVLGGRRVFCLCVRLGLLVRN